MNIYIVSINGTPACAHTKLEDAQVAQASLEYKHKPCDSSIAEIPLDPTVSEFMALDPQAAEYHLLFVEKWYAVYEYAGIDFLLLTNSEKRVDQEASSWKKKGELNVQTITVGKYQ